MADTGRKVPVYHFVMAAIGTAWAIYLFDGVWRSLLATISYAAMAMREPAVGTMVGVVVQFSQQGALFIKNRVKPGGIEWWACWILFVVSFLLDAMTNIGEWRSKAPMAKNAEEQASADFFGTAMCIGYTMFEEILSYAAAMSLHHFNEVLRAFGKQIPALEWAEERIEETKIFGGSKPPREEPPRKPSGRSESGQLEFPK